MRTGCFIGLGMLLATQSGCLCSFDGDLGLDLGLDTEPLFTTFVPEFPDACEAFAANASDCGADEDFETLLEDCRADATEAGQRSTGCAFAHRNLLECIVEQGCSAGGPQAIPSVCSSEADDYDSTCADTSTDTSGTDGTSSSGSGSDSTSSSGSDSTSTSGSSSTSTTTGGSDSTG